MDDQWMGGNQLVWLLVGSMLCAVLVGMSNGSMCFGREKHFDGIVECVV